MTKDAMLLTGPLGLGHEMMARCCARLLERSGWRTRRLDSMSLLGPWSGGVGERAFNRLVAIPGLYDGLHFAHLRTGAGSRTGWTGRRAPGWCPPCGPN